MKKSSSYLLLALSALLACGATVARAELKLPAIVGSNMVLQRDTDVNVWGWDNPGQSVTVEFAGQSVTGTAGDDGKWTATLKPMGVSAEGRTMKIKGSSEASLDNILVGEVWLCSGQSNMQWAVNQADDPDLELLAANYPNLRLITVPQVGTQEAQNDFEGQWEPCTPEVAANFSAVGYFFGRGLHQILDIPVGLIDNAWGGSAAEAWVRRDLLEADPLYKPYLDQWAEIEKTYDHEKAVEAYNKQMEAWKEKQAAAKAEGKPAPPQPRAPRNQLTGQHRPANLYNGVLHPIIGYGIKGAIWYQGETNAGRGENYRYLFPLMIQSWREEWGIGDFSFYWVSLADFQAEVTEPADSSWAELRESQTKTLSLPNTGEAIIYDLGEGRDIHPRDKQNVAKRLLRHALAKDYGYELVSDSPKYVSHEIKGNKVVLTFENVGSSGLYTFDVNEPVGFQIAGEDQKFVWADAKLVGKDKIEVWNPDVANPVAVRYAWATNPVANVESREGLPLTPFRTDDWKLSTAQ